MFGMYFGHQCKHTINVHASLISRYDEWIRPEQIVNVINKPSDIAALKKKAKESPPKSPKGPVSIDSFAVREELHVNRDKAERKIFNKLNTDLSKSPFFIFVYSGQQKREIPCISPFPLSVSCARSPAWISPGETISSSHTKHASSQTEQAATHSLQQHRTEGTRQPPRYKVYSFDTKLFSLA